MKKEWEVKTQYDDDRLTSENAIWWKQIDKWCHNMMTIDWQVKVQYDENRLTSESAKW